MTTPRKKPVRRKVKPRAISVLETKPVPIGELKMFHKNPRIGNVNAIAASLEENGQFRPVVVNIGTHTGRHNEILGGNHTYLGMKKLGEKLIYASFVDVNDEQATKIVLADNKTADLGSYDEKIIADLFSSLPDIAGTGYTQEELEDVMSSVAYSIGDHPDVDVDSLIAGVNMGDEDTAATDRDNDIMSARERYKAQRESDDDGEDRSVRITATDDTDAELDTDADSTQIDKLAELQVILELKEDNVWKNPNDFYGIPEIPERSILKEFPKDVVTWIGHQFTEQKPGRHYLYNYSLGGTKGLDFTKTILAFNTYDTKFLSWWETPAYNLARLMVKGLKTAVVPDFSYYYTECRVHHIWGVYRANWLGKFFAEAGLNVVPRLQWDFRDPHFEKTALLGVPKNTPTLECSIQNINEEADRKIAAKQLRALLEDIKPRQFMVYGGKPGQRLVAESGWKGQVIPVLSYANARRESGAYDRKEGTKSLTAKQKKELQAKYGVKKKVRREDGEDVNESEYFADDED